MSFKVIVLRNFSWACRQQVHVCFTCVQCTTATGLDYKNYSCIDAYLGKITDGTVTPCTLRKIPAGIIQCFGLGQSVLRYSLLVSLSSLLLQHCFLCKCDYLVQWFTSAGPYVMAGVAFPLSYSLCEPIYVNLFYNYQLSNHMSQQPISQF